MWLLLSTLSCGLLKVSGQYALVKKIGTWTDANTNCTLARPDINWLSQENTVELAPNITNEIGEAWIGYAQYFDIFQYIGCVRVQDITDSTINYTKKRTPHSPGHCFHACRNSTMFGLRTTGGGRDCFCFENSIGDIQKTRNKCTVRCNNDIFVCGNRGSLSVYGKVNITKQNTDKDKCLRFKDDDTSTPYKWKTCDAKISRSRCVTDVNGTSPTLDGPKLRWEDAMNDCFKINHLPMTGEHNNQSLKHEKYWTAYVNAVTIFGGENTSKIDGFGYIVRKDNTLKLKFTQKKDKTKTALCQIATSTTTTTTTNQHPESDVQVSGDSKAGIYVSIPLVIIVCVCVAIVLLIWYRKRQGRKKADHTLSTRSNQCYDGSIYDELDFVNMTEENGGKQTNKLQESGDASRIPNTLADMHYESLDVHAAGIYDFALDMSDDTENKNTAEPSYFVLEKVERPPEVSSNEKMSTPEAITDLTDTAYNTANHNTDADNYDHVEKKKLNAVGGHYDTTFSSVESEPDYDTTNQSRNVKGEQDGTYDSTNCTNGGEKVYPKGRKHDDCVNGNFNN